MRAWLRRRLRLQWRRIGVAVRDPRPRLHHRQRRQRRRRHLHLLAGRARHFGYSLLWMLIPITIALVVVQEMCARMGAVTGKGLERSHPRGVRLPRHVLRDAGAARHELRQRGGGVRRGRPQPRAVRHRRYVSCRSARRSSGGWSCSGTYTASRRSSSSRACSTSPTSSRACSRSPTGRPRPRRQRGAAPMPHRTTAGIVDGHRPRRHDDRAVDAVLPAVVDRREGQSTVAAVPASRLDVDPRLPVRGRRRVLHHRRLRGDAARRGGIHDIADAAPTPRRRCAPLAGEDAVAAVRRGPLQRVAVRGVDPADLDGVRRLRRPRLRVGPRQEVPRGAGVLLALHAADRAGAAGMILLPRGPARCTSSVLSQVLNGVLLPFVLVFMLLLDQPRG